MTACSAEALILPIKEIRLNGGTQMRQEINQDVVQDYAEVLDELPPVVVFDDGNKHWLADGFHRVKAAVFAGRDSIRCEIRRGSRRDAVLFAVGANANHGVRRTNADKRKAVVALLSDREWCRWSDREIARQCAVSGPLVTVLRREIEGPTPDPNRRRLAVHSGRIVSRPAEHVKKTSSENGETMETMRCPFCKRRFKLSDVNGRH
jgi:hypothetical protein